MQSSAKCYVMKRDWSKFALALVKFFNSNFEVERAFSVEADVHHNPKKNIMSQEMFDTDMHIRLGVGSELIFDKDSCEKCVSSRKRVHCHCSLVPATDPMNATAPNDGNIRELREANISERRKKDKNVKGEVKLTRKKICWKTHGPCLFSKTQKDEVVILEEIILLGT